MTTIVKDRKQKSAESEELVEAKEPILTKKQLFICVFFVVYCLAYYVLGFVITSILLMVAIPIIMGYKKYITIGISAVAIVAAIYAIFFYYLQLPQLTGISITSRLTYTQRVHLSRRLVILGEFFQGYAILTIPHYSIITVRATHKGAVAMIQIATVLFNFSY